VSSGTLRVQVHPAPQFTLTCSTCTGLQAKSVDGATPGLPLFSYGKLTYDETWPISSTDSIVVWGAVNTLKYTVTNPYAGAGALSFFPFYQFGYQTVKADGTASAYTPLVDLKTGGLRTVTPSGVTGGGGTDSGLSVGGAYWLSGVTSPNISAHPGGSETITVEIITDQGVVIPPTGG
jgi:hypothetical protein